MGARSRVTLDLPKQKPPPTPSPQPEEDVEEEEVIEETEEFEETSSELMEVESGGEHIKRKTRSPGYVFTEEQEVLLAEWYCDTECFYNKRLKLYKDTEYKKRLMEEKARSLDPPCTCKYIDLK